MQYYCLIYWIYSAANLCKYIMILVADCVGHVTILCILVNVPIIGGYAIDFFGVVFLLSEALLNTYCQLIAQTTQKLTPNLYGLIILKVRLYIFLLISLLVCIYVAVFRKLTLCCKHIKTLAYRSLSLGVVSRFPVICPVDDYGYAYAIVAKGQS